MYVRRVELGSGAYIELFKVFKNKAVYVCLLGIHNIGVVLRSVSAPTGKYRVD